MEVEDVAHFPLHAPITPAQPSCSLILHLYLYPHFGIDIITVQTLFTAIVVVQLPSCI